MRKHWCDKCGKEGVPLTDFEWWTTYRKNFIIFKFSRSICAEREICNGCYRKLNEVVDKWFKESLQ